MTTSSRGRFEMMLQKSRAMAEQLERLGHGNARSVRYVVIGATAFPIEDAAGRPKDIEDLRGLRKLRDSP